MWRQGWVRLRSLWRWRGQEAELDEEIRFHLAEEMEELLAAGMSPAAARAAARRDFGNVPLIRELTRETWGWRPVERLLQDARSAIRAMRRTPGYTCTVVLTLALGIGLNAAIFSVVNAALLQALPYPDADRLVVVDDVLDDDPVSTNLVSAGQYESWATFEPLVRRPRRLYGRVLQPVLWWGVS